MQYLFDETGRRYLDAFARIVTVSCGHCHPDILNAVIEQSKLLQHATTIYLHHAIADFAEALASKMPGNLKVMGKGMLVIISDSGKLSFLTFCNEMHRFFPVTHVQLSIPGNSKTPDWYDLQHSGVYDIIGKHEDSATCIEYSPETDYLTVSAGPMDLQWLALPLPSSTYYIALYFADDRASSRRAFDISINNVPYVRNLSVTPSGVAVFATKWPLDGLTRLRFTPVNGSDASPLINGGEIFDVLSLGNSA